MNGAGIQLSSNWSPRFYVTLKHLFLRSFFSVCSRQSSLLATKEVKFKASLK